VALKKIKKKNLKDHQLHVKLQYELNSLYGLDHQHIIKLYTHFETKKCIFMVQEFANAGSLKAEMIRLQKKKLNTSLVRDWIK
jgi:serine/threonine protein kinase